MKSFFTHKFREKSPIEIIGIVIFIGLFITAVIALVGYIAMSLWNNLMPEIFGLPTLSYWQTIGLGLLIKILFGGFGCGGSKKSSNNSNKKCKDKNTKTDFSKWKHYDKFWEEEGSLYYDKYVEKQNNKNEPLQGE